MTRDKVTRQLELNFEAGLTERYETLDDVVAAVVSKHGFKTTLAADLDIQPSTFSRMLNPQDHINFPVGKLPKLCKLTGDFRPIYWLIEECLEDEEIKQKRALSALPGMIDDLTRILKAAGVK